MCRLRTSIRAIAAVKLMVQYDVGGDEDDEADADASGGSRLEDEVENAVGFMKVRAMTSAVGGNRHGSEDDDDDMVQVASGDNDLVVGKNGDQDGGASR